MKSEILSQFQSSMYELDSLSTFGRGKDKKKRKSKGSAVTGGLAAAGVASGAAGVGLNKIQSSTAVTGRNLGKAAANVEKKAFKNAVNGVASPEQSAKLAGSLKKMASNRLGVSKLAGKGKIAAGVAAGGLLAGAAVNALRNRKKNK